MEREREDNSTEERRERGGKFTMAQSKTISIFCKDKHSAGSGHGTKIYLSDFQGAAYVDEGRWPWSECIL